MKDYKGWDDYWTGSRSGAAFSSEGAQHPGLSAFWAQQFGGMGPVDRVLDVACGRGALLDYLNAAEVPVSEIISVDYSEGAQIVEGTSQWCTGGSSRRRLVTLSARSHEPGDQPVRYRVCRS